MCIRDSTNTSESASVEMMSEDSDVPSRNAVDIRACVNRICDTLTIHVKRLAMEWADTAWPWNGLIQPGNGKNFAA